MVISISSFTTKFFLKMLLLKKNTKSRFFYKKVSSFVEMKCLLAT